METIEDNIQNVKDSLGDELRLIASANYASPAVKRAIGGVATDVYAEGSVAMRYVGGSEGYDAVETYAIKQAKSLFGGDYATVQPLSGALANYVVYHALLKPGDTVLAMGLSAGGHLTHGAPFNLSGKTYRFAHYDVDSNGYIDYDQVADVAKEVKPKLIVAGSSSYPRAIDVAAMKGIADTYGARLHFDAAHYAGLIATGHYPNPLAYGADTMSFSTYKTIRGPRGACVVGTSDVAKQIERTVFPGIQSGPNEASIFGIAVALAEVATEDYKDYIEATINNARVVAATLMDRGYHIVTGGTDTHIVLADLSQSSGALQSVTGREAERLCAEMGITVNKNLISQDRRSAQVTSGMRLGLQAMTARGVSTTDAGAIAGYVDMAIRETNEQRRSRLAAQVLALCRAYPIPTDDQPPRINYFARYPVLCDYVNGEGGGGLGGLIYAKQPGETPYAWLEKSSSN